MAHWWNRYRDDLKTNFSLAYPVMLSQLGHVMMGVMDSVMVGHVGATSLAGASLSNVVFNVILFFGIGVSYAITPLIASADGQQDKHRIIQVLRHGLAINVTNAAVLACIVYFCRPLLYHIGQPDEVVEIAMPYLSIVAASLLPTLIFQTFRQFTEGLSQTRIAMAVILGANVLNILLNYIFIYGHLGLPALGLTGAGIATFLSRAAMAASIVLAVYFGKRFRAYRPAFRFKAYSQSLFSEMLHIGLPAGAQFILEAAAFDFSAVMMGWLGTQTLAAHHIAINMATVSYMITSGLGAAATIRVGYFIGAGDPHSLRRAIQSLLGMAMAIMTAWALLFILGRHWLPTLYIDDMDVIRTAGPLMIVAGLFQLSDGTQVVCASALRGFKDVKVPMLYIFVAYWVIGLPLGYWLAFKMNMGGAGIWTGLLIGLSVTAAAMLLRLRHQIQKRLVTPVAD
ncbi:MAG: MATE family efflux transporter [Cyclobacteriaceae bacterium]|nr:MATE family efflux transporter [Cyclobacteriaceae bacterium]